MALCHVSENSDTYGVGIRIAFYLQWFGMIVTSWALESDALNLKLINALTTAATSVGLILNLERLQSVEIYIVLLLACGTLYFTVPIYFWRLVTCCRPWWDPERWTKIKTGWLFRALNSSMYGALLSLHIWFWCKGVHERRETDPEVDADADCEQFGFLFAQVRLDESGLVILNIIFHFTILLVGAGIAANRLGILEGCFWDKSQRRRRWR